MSQDTTIARLKALIRKAGHLEAPAVELLKPEVRTGDKFLLRDPFNGKAGQTNIKDKAERRLTRGAVGGIVVEWGYDVSASNMAAFLTFLDTYEETLLDARPRGVRYKGTYAVFSSTEKNAGDFRTVWAYRDFGDLDALSDEYENTTQFASLVKQLRSFADPSPTAARSQQIYLLANSSRQSKL